LYGLNKYGYFTRPWNSRKVRADRLVDDPKVTALLKSTIGPHYHFCHSALHVSVRGSGPIGFHQDHHHWFHENSVNLSEREKYHIQVLYYPNGFTRGDKSLTVIPGSHLVTPTKDVTPERLPAGDFNDQAGRGLRAKQLEMPPGSMVYINARMVHAVAPKPLNSPQPYRIFFIDIFKEAGRR
jgi:ectoine hydroxylase-related dioxygenase (phytanoyl-CoA dioxygenase family)